MWVKGRTGKKATPDFFVENCLGRHRDRVSYVGSGGDGVLTKFRTERTRSLENMRIVNFSWKKSIFPVSFWSISSSIVDRKIRTSCSSNNDKDGLNIPQSLLGQWPWL